MDDCDIRRWLKAGDRASLEYRVIRARKLLNEWRLYDFDYLLHGGTDAAQALHEAKFAFLYGCNISVILLSLMFIEKELAGYLYLIGSEDVIKMRLEAILSKSLELGYISKEEFDTFNRLRDIRNAYTHFRLPIHSSTTIMRSVNERATPDDLFEKDAFGAMQALVSFLHRGLTANT